MSKTHYYIIRKNILTFPYYAYEVMSVTDGFEKKVTDCASESEAVQLVKTLRKEQE